VILTFQKCSRSVSSRGRSASHAAPSGTAAAFARTIGGTSRRLTAGPATSWDSLRTSILRPKLRERRRQLRHGEPCRVYFRIRESAPRSTACRCRNSPSVRWTRRVAARRKASSNDTEEMHDQRVSGVGPVDGSGVPEQDVGGDDSEARVDQRGHEHARVHCGQTHLAGTFPGLPARCGPSDDQLTQVIHLDEGGRRLSCGKDPGGGRLADGRWSGQQQRTQRHRRRLRRPAISISACNSRQHGGTATVSPRRRRAGRRHQTGRWGCCPKRCRSPVRGPAVRRSPPRESGRRRQR
jgi:hypothetical protein